jgi:hypothetical protein
LIDEHKADLIKFFKEGEEVFLSGLDRMKLNVEFDQRWLSIGRTHLEEGFAALVRAVERPERISLEGTAWQTGLPV